MAKGGTSKDLGKRIATARQRADLSQTALGMAVRTTRSAVSQWESGSTEPTAERLRAIAMQTGVNYDWLATGRSGATQPDDEAKTIPIKGYVTAGAQAHYLPLHDDEFDRVEPISGTTERTIALEIRGDSLGELFDRWLVFFDDVRTPVTPDLLGKLCVIWLPDERVLVKKLKKGTKSGRFTLISDGLREPPIENVAVRAAARVKTMAPR